MITFSNSSRTIDSLHHFHIQRIRLLRMREERERSGLCYIEGLRFVHQAVLHQVKIETLVVCRPLLTLPFSQKLVRHLRQRGIPILEVSPDVMYSLTLVNDSQGLGAVVRQQWEPLEHVRPTDELCWIALHTVRSPGNLGTILRTSDAVGGAGIIIVGKDVDPYDPAVVRATMGSMFTQRFVRTRLAEFRRWKQHHQYMLVGTSPTASVDYHAVKYQTPVILLMGDERKGLTPDLQSLCDVMVRIPMVGKNDSLNLAVATSIMLYEVFNQQRSRHELSPLAAP